MRNDLLRTWFAALLLMQPTIAGAATVAVMPGSSIRVPGESFTLELVGTGFDDGILDGGGVSLSYDPSVFVVTAVTVNEAEWEFFSDPGVIDNVAGTVTGISFNSFAGRSGVLHFATLELLAIAPGTSGLLLEEFALNPFSSGGSAYPGLALSSAATVTVVPLPATVWLLACATFALAGLRRSA